MRPILGRFLLWASFFSFVIAVSCAPSQQRIENLIRGHKFDEARDLADKLIANRPDDGTALFLSGTVNLYLKKYALAEKEFTKAEALEPDLRETICRAALEAGKYFATSGDLEGAKYAFASALVRNADIHHQITNWVYAEWSAQADPAAPESECYFFLLKQFLGDLPLMQNLREIEQRAAVAKEWEKAATMVELQIDAAPVTMDVKDLHTMALVYEIRSGNEERIRAKHEGLAATYPEDALFSVNLAMFLLDAGHPTAALESIELTNGQSPSSAAPAIGLAIIRLSQGDRSAATEVYESYRLANRESPDGYATFLEAKYMLLNSDVERAALTSAAAFRQRPILASLAQYDPAFDPVRAHPVFQQAAAEALAQNQIIAHVE